jgi:death-on-curing family protein
MTHLEFPEKKQIEWWINHLKQTDAILQLSLPAVDEKWFDDICNIVQRLQFSFMPQDLHTVAAYLFYNIAKRHDILDGNKRSAIVVIYLFYLINGYILLQGSKIRLLAKSVASSHGSRQEQAWLRKIRDQLSSRAIPISNLPD